MRKGLTLPNREWTRYTAAELAALRDLGATVLVVLLYGGTTDQVHRDQLEPFLVSHPGIRILARPFADAIPRMQPVWWAGECVRRLALWPGAELLPDNERNLPSEGGSNDWPAHIAWLTTFDLHFRAAAPNVLVHLSALSPGGDGWTDGLRAYAAAGLPALFDRVDAHGYGPRAGTDVATAAGILGRSVDVTEFNGADPGLLAGEVGQKADSLCYFLLGGSADQAEYDILGLPNAYASFKAWTPGAPPRGGSVITEAEFERLAKNVWDEAKVPYNPASALATYWRDQWHAGHFLGAPTEPEHESEDGTLVLQAFAGGYLWCKKSDFAVQATALPFG